jgi:TPR repeat protein
MILRSGNAEGVVQDGPRALQLFQGACEKDYRNGCFMASVMLLRGK